jgi:hypothetical protein
MDAVELYRFASSVADVRTDDLNGRNQTEGATVMRQMHRPMVGSVFAFGLTTMLVTNAALGSLVTDVIRYRMLTTLINQLIALLDLGIAVPAAVAAGIGLVRGTA